MEIKENFPCVSKFSKLNPALKKSALTLPKTDVITERDSHDRHDIIQQYINLAPIKWSSLLTKNILWGF
jgi:hypothetical protein